MTAPLSDALTSRDVLDGLHGRWPDDQYLFIQEAPQDSARQGRRIDALVVSLWKSRGHELDAVEVKISASDWKRELDNPEKADWWFEHTNRYWIAVPTVLAAKVRAELPVAWGLLAVGGGRCKEVVKAPKHSATPFDWPQTIGIMRAAADAGVSALARSHQTGYQLGRQHGEDQAIGKAGEDAARDALQRLEAVVAEFKSACGIDLGGTWGSTSEARRIGELVHMLRHGIRRPESVLQPLRRQAQVLANTADHLTKLEQELGEALASVELGDLGDTG